jgi:hypothetical protein
MGLVVKKFHACTKPFMGAAVCTLASVTGPRAQEPGRRPASNLIELLRIVALGRPGPRDTALGILLRDDILESDGGL